ncbi:MAG: hypothetical protein HY817_00190 [Candidatus Abawacabacteria bacterium]|nr:hypothetical protein [Candidatus Abawacabacteria bacterium]
MAINSPYLVGIAGPSGAGKSTVAQNIVKCCPQVTHFKLDNFFKSLIEFPRYKEWPNREVPENLLWQEFFTALKALKNNQSVIVPTYSMAADAPIGTHEVKPTPIILVEGYLLFLYEHISDLFDFRLFLDVPVNTQLERRLMRQPNMDIDYFQEVTVSVFKQYGEPTKNIVHKVIDGRKDEEALCSEIVELMKRRVPELLSDIN